MPIRPENKDRYPKNWKEISRLAKERARYQCEWCGVPDRKIIRRDANYKNGWRRITSEEANSFYRNRRQGYTYWQALRSLGLTKIILTVAHLDHNPENCAPENLVALCQKCHLNYDKDIHGKNATIGRFKRKTREMQILL